MVGFEQILDLLGRDDTFDSAGLRWLGALAVSSATASGKPAHPLTIHLYRFPTL